MSAAKRRRLAPILEEQLQALQDELEYERKLRRIDQKQAEREKLRLEKLVAAAVAETEEERALAQELREEIADHQERLERSRESVLRHVQELERWDETPPDVNIKAENHRLQTELDALEEQLVIAHQGQERWGHSVDFFQALEQEGLALAGAMSHELHFAFGEEAMDVFVFGDCGIE